MPVILILGKALRKRKRRFSQGEGLRVFTFFSVSTVFSVFQVVFNVFSIFSVLRGFWICGSTYWCGVQKVGSLL